MIARRNSSGELEAFEPISADRMPGFRASTRRPSSARAIPCLAAGIVLAVLAVWVFGYLTRPPMPLDTDTNGNGIVLRGSIAP